MDKRLVHLLQSGKIGWGNLYLLDTYNQAVHEDVSCTIRTNINTANHHFIFERMNEIKYVGQMSSSQNSRVIDPNGIFYAMANGEKDGTPKIIEALAVGRERTEEEKKRRRIHGDKGAKFSQGKQMCLLGDVSGCLTTMPAKDNLVGVIYNKDVAMTKEPIIIDDYNQRVPQDQDVIGTVTTQFGNPAPRHGYKIAEPLRIPKATKQGYIEVPPGSLFDMSYPESKTRRGRVQEGGKVSPTLMASGEAPCLYEGIKNITNEEAGLFKDSNKTYSGEILRLLQHKFGEETYKWAIGRFRYILKKEILQSGLHEESICETRDKQSGLFSCTPHIQKDCVSDRRKGDDLREVRIDKKHRCASHRWELSEQFKREFDDIVSELSLKNSSSKIHLRDLWETFKSPQSLQLALLTMEEIWESFTRTVECTKETQYRIRKLTPREVFRLMGVSEVDIDKIQQSGVSQSQQYKMAGNSIVVDVLEHIFRKMFVETEQESQQLSLF